jgi:Macrocin-O-methyltransferase (TylF)
MANPPIVTRGSAQEISARAALLDLLKKCPIPDDQLLVNLGAFVRSTVLAKILYLDELYRLITNVPGSIVEFGVWWGANLALLESFRSVYEPYNWTRKVIGFDTFEGYASAAPIDGDSPYTQPGGYSVTSGYEAYLRSLLDAHEADNVLAHIPKYELVKGDVTRTVDEYVAKNPHTVIALAYFDLALYEPTKRCLQAIRPYLVPGSVIAMDQLNCADFPGETIAFREVFGSERFQIARSRFLPDRSIVILT